MPYPVLGRSLRVAAVTLAISSFATPAQADVRSLTDFVLAADKADPVALVVPPAPTPNEIALDEAVARGRHWRIDSERGPIHVWIPAGYDAATAATVVFVHGYFVSVDEAWADYRLPQQFALSGINAMFIAAQSPMDKRDSLTWPSLHALVRTVKDSVDVTLPSKRLVAVGHSGAYRTLANWLPNELLDTVVLLDAMYGEYRFMPWVREDKQRRLVNIAYETQGYSNWMHRHLPSTVKLDGLPEQGFPDARILYATTDVGHWQLVTDGIALPLALRAIGVGAVADAPVDIPLGLPLRCEPIDHAFAPKLAEVAR
ncbi:MAG TPA: hypothetical protein VIV11_35145 [Kofleriaceae bacterium]